MNTRELTATEKLAAHAFMRREFVAWNPEKDSLFDLSERLNAAAARAIRSIKNARREAPGTHGP